MKAFFTALSFSPAFLLAHTGHPGPAAHGNATHFMMGLFAALPITLLIVGLKTRKRTAAKVRKQD